MAKEGKNLRAAREKVELEKSYMPTEGISLVKECATAKFNESVDVSINLGVDPRKSEQNVRGSTVLPNGTGKTVRVAVFAEGAQADAAKAAGADLVGLEDLAEQVKKGEMDFDIAIAAPDAMRVVGQLGQILGPRGLMPNPKVGTVSADVATAVKNAKAGQVQFKTEKGGVVHCSIGSVQFEVQKLEENLKALIADLVKAKPSSAKGVYIKKVVISSTMGVGVTLDQTALA
ncbi:MAG: 50S ribosomal protein L1 [Gammaproteobacteria bacterium]|nr:MAG: 50S ribosomal protein L1 [Gammaproteobacteria bacterium]